MLEGYPIALGFILHRRAYNHPIKSQRLCVHQHRKSVRSQVLPTTLFMPRITGVSAELKTAMLNTRQEDKAQVGRRVLSIYSLFKIR